MEEPFAKGQKGSSAMPHKRNPIGCEQIVGMAYIAAKTRRIRLVAAVLVVPHRPAVLSAVTLH